MIEAKQVSPTAQQITDRLAVYLGAHTARVAVKTFAERAVGHGSDLLAPGDVPALVKGLRPMLRTFVGSAQCEVILNQIVRENGA